ncbi:hypothetical protein IFR05_016012 [Cadophora sp. M221]|nr:hypothetical protein IFR05_016012 [Cadophora sp. M221]
MKPAASKPHVGFKSLPTETILILFSQLTDLPTLHSLISASPVAYRLFRQHGIEIVESMMKSGNTTNRIPEIIRLVAFIRSQSLPIHSLEEFQERVVRQSMMQQRTNAAFLPGTLPANTQPVVLRSILASATRISHLTSDCLEFHLDRLATVEPEVLVDENFTYRQGHPPRFSAIPAWRMRPEGRKSTLGKLEQSSWTEVQRVERAFWRVQFLHDLKVAAARSLLPWSADDLARLQQMEPIDFYNKSSYAEYEEVNTVVDYLHELRARDANNLPPMCDDFPPLPFQKRKMSNHYPRLMPDKDDHDHLRIPAPGYSHWRGLSANSNSPLRYITFESFRRLGFALWSRERMASLGLLKPGNQAHGSKSTDYYFFMWKSILSNDEVLEVERVNEERERRSGIPLGLGSFGGLGLH